MDNRLQAGRGAENRQPNTTTTTGSVIAAMYACLAMTVVAIILAYVDLAASNTLTDHIRAGYPTYTQTRIDTAATTYLVYLSIIGVLGVVGWPRFSRRSRSSMGVAAPAVGAPGGTPGVYSNTNYLLLCQLLEQITGTTAEKCITQNVIERAGLRDTELPAGTHVKGVFDLGRAAVVRLDSPVTLCSHRGVVRP